MFIHKRNLQVMGRKKKIYVYICIYMNMNYVTRVTTLLAPKPIKFNRDVEGRKLLFIALVSNCLHRSCLDILEKVPD